MNITQHSTVCTVEQVRDSAQSPAIGEVRLSTGEVFPIFDAAIMVDAQLHADHRTAVLPILAESGKSSTVYLRGLRQIDVLADRMLCLQCGGEMQRWPASPNNGGVDQFACPSCARRIYLGPVRAFRPEHPMQARARIDIETDGVFALDHAKRHAVLMETFDALMPDTKPFNGIRAELEPFAESHVLNSLGLLPYQRRSLRSDLKLRLHGAPFNGRVAYKVI